MQCLLARGGPLCALPSRRALLAVRGRADRSPGKQRRGRPRAGRLRRRPALRTVSPALAGWSV